MTVFRLQQSRRVGEASTTWGDCFFVLFFFLDFECKDMNLCQMRCWRSCLQKSLVRSCSAGMRSERQKETARGERCSRELELSQAMLICRYIKKLEHFFRNIDYHTTGMKNNIGHRLRGVSTQIMDRDNRDCLHYVDRKPKRPVTCTWLVCSLVANK